MIEKVTESSPNPEQPRIDQEFYAASSRWFNSNKEELLAHAGDKEEDVKYAFYQDELKEQITTLAQPKLLERKIQRDGTAEKYGQQEARARSAAEGMAILGFHLSHIDSTQALIDNHEEPGDKKVFAEVVRKGKEAKALFIQASEKVFTPLNVSDPKQEVSAITKTYERLMKDPDGAAYAGLMVAFEQLGESSDDPARLKRELAYTIDRLGSNLGETVGFLAQDTGEFSPEQEDKTRLVLAAGNKLLYRLVKVQEKLAQ